MNNMKRIISIISIALIMTACSEKNPFLAEWDTPYGIPPYEEIEVGDYIPAIQKGIEQQNAEIEAITSNPDTPTFENTIVPLELSGDILSKVTGVLYNVSETDRSDSLDAVVAEALPLLSGHSDNIAFNRALYNRVAAIYEADQSGLTREQQVVLKKYYDDFRRNGIDLPEETQDRLREINSEIATKTQQIGNNILAESNAFAEKFGFSVSEYPSKMTTTEDRELRRQYNEAYTSRGANGNEYDNSSLILDVMKLRIEKAKLLGYDTPADYILSDKMAGSPERVDSFLSGIMTAAVAKAREELGSKIEPWDWWYYAEKVRKARYDLDENEVRSYFNVDRVRDGIFRAAQILYGINAEKIDGVPVYNPGVDTYKITDADGSFVGIFTTDYFPRASKRGGAWMNNVRQQYVDAEGNDVRPIIVNVGNLSENMNIDEVQTVFHEFGHALHGLLSKCTYPSVSGTNVTRDYVEMFSQFNENWAFQPDLLAVYAKNSDGEVIPVELVEKINNSLKFNQGFMTTELCAAAILDMKWHELESVDGIDVAGFEKKVCEEMGLIPEIAPRYRTTYFNHIFSSGYEAGYYGYLWAEVLDKDAFSAFLNSPNGTWDLGLARKFREIFLERGGSEEPMELYKEFMGREPDSRAMLLGRGLLSEDTDE